jgi:hypothetical protein
MQEFSLAHFLLNEIFARNTNVEITAVTLQLNQSSTSEKHANGRSEKSDY